MTEPAIKCPNCSTEIKLTEQLAAPMLAATRQKFEHAMAQKDAEVAKREGEIARQQALLAKEKAAVAEHRKAKQLAASDLDQMNRQLLDLQNVLREREGKLAEAQKAQAELIRKQRELDDARREMDLTIEKKVQESLSTVRDKAKQEAEEGLKLRLLEKEEQMSSMQRQIEDLKRKAEQGSQQLQGEALELELEQTLRARFPRDLIEPVPKGEFGGDVLHRVLGPFDQACGTILW